MFSRKINLLLNFRYSTLACNRVTCKSLLGWIQGNRRIQVKSDLDTRLNHALQRGMVENRPSLTIQYTLNAFSKSQVNNLHINMFHVMDCPLLTQINIFDLIHLSKAFD